MGDASGVGPEILLRSFEVGTIPGGCVVFGDSSILERGCDVLGIDVPINHLSHLDNVKEGSLNLWDCGCLQASDLTPGVLSEAAGDAAHQYVTLATLAALRGEVSAIVTLPMNKEATQRTHPTFTGHTELLGEICDVDDVVMMLATNELAVSHVSTHVSLRNAIERMTASRLKRTIELTDETLKRFLAQPRIGVCGLNPHAGESGMFGTEEREVIEPVIAESNAEGVQVSGPYPADTVFRQAIELDRFDALICMYHDQGHAPMKLLAFDRAVNVTLGLPIIRTSVDHGTAFDIAWKGVARIDSLAHAIRYAEKMLSPPGLN